MGFCQLGAHAAARRRRAELPEKAARLDPAQQLRLALRGGLGEPKEAPALTLATRRILSMEVMR